MRWQDWVKGPAAYAALGLGGARRWDVSPKISRIFVILMVFLAILLLLQWQLIEKQALSFEARRSFNICIWLGFLIDFCIPIYWVKDRWTYVRDNWMLVLILLVGTLFLVPFFHAGKHLNIVRPVLALYILVPSFSMILAFFVDGLLMTTLIAAAIIVAVFGLLVAGVDPNIHHAWDGLWWALATVSTVGYGDVVPQSLVGRLLGMILIVIGIGIFVVLTANFLGLILSRSIKKRTPEKHAEPSMELLDMMVNLAEEQKNQMELLEQLKIDIGKLHQKEQEKP